jgi:hypothetical protein
MEIITGILYEFVAIEGEEESFEGDSGRAYCQNKKNIASDGDLEIITCILYECVANEGDVEIITGILMSVLPMKAKRKALW